MCSFVFFNDTATTEIYTLSLHDALPISPSPCARPCRARKDGARAVARRRRRSGSRAGSWVQHRPGRSEEHTSELQSRQYLVCRLLLEKKQQQHRYIARSLVFLSMLTVSA